MGAKCVPVTLSPRFSGSGPPAPTRTAPSASMCKERGVPQHAPITNSEGETISFDATSLANQFEAPFFGRAYVFLTKAAVSSSHKM
jgi:hypothetical protein